MGQLGLGAMIQMLFGNDNTSKAVTDSIGKKITEASLNDDVIRLRFSDGTTLKITDEGQSCCEHRYISTDADLADLVGHSLVSIELADGGEVEDGYGLHEMMFLKITASSGTVTLCTHNEHNGYYGGFSIRAMTIEGEEKNEQRKDKDDQGP